jgi:hypothetical protein
MNRINQEALTLSWFSRIKKRAPIHRTQLGRTRFNGQCIIINFYWKHTAKGEHIMFIITAVN